jgi:4-alpha-glucanotransferase
MPLGVNAAGYDAWHFRDLFAEGVSAGAPPDPLFTGGQDWGFRPLVPHALRTSGYRYFIDTLRLRQTAESHRGRRPGRATGRDSFQIHLRTCS